MIFVVAFSSSLDVAAIEIGEGSGGCTCVPLPFTRGARRVLVRICVRLCALVCVCVRLQTTC